MAILQLYKNEACTELWQSVPIIELSPSRIGWGQTPAGAITLGDKTYKYFDVSMYSATALQDIPQIKAAPFMSRYKQFTTQQYYCKNGYSLELGVTDSAMIMRNYKFGSGFLGFSEQSAGVSDNQIVDYWVIGFTDPQDGTRYIGFTRVLIPTGAPWPGYVGPTSCIEASFWETALRPPYDYGGEDDPDGGQGSGHYNHTGVSDSNTPLGIMPTGGRGLHYYKINGDAYSSLQGYLWGDASTIGKSLWQKFINRTHTPISCVIGCFAIPEAFAPAGGGSDPIQIAGVRLSPIAGSCLSFDPVITNHEFTFPAQSGADKCFTDYSHTTCKLYVPYCGTIPIPMELALDREIKVRYRVDQANGNLCACVWAGDCVVGELSGNCAYQIPVIGGDDGSLDVLGSTITGLIQISSGDYRGALQSGAEALTAQHTTQIVNGDLSGAVSRCSLRRPYIEYTRNANTYTPGYFRTVGIPARISGTLSSFAGGYGEFDAQIASADIPGATGDEIAEITSLLREGVFV